MKRAITLIIVAIVCLFILSSCHVGNRQTGMDTIQTFDRYIIEIGGDVYKGNIKSWRDFENSDVVQVVSTNGEVYLTHYSNAMLVRNKR